MLQAVESNNSNKIVLPPTMNPLRFFRDYLSRMIAVLEAHTMSQRMKLNPSDNDMLRQVIIRAAYFDIILKDLLERYGDELPEHYNFAEDVDHIIRLTNKEVNTPSAPGSVSISIFHEVNSVLQGMIESYYHIPVRRPFWRAWFG